MVLGAAGLLILGSIFGPTAGTAAVKTGGLAPHIRFLLWGIPATALLAAALFVRRVETYAGRFLLELGNASYSIYLTHQFVMTVYAKILKAQALADVLPRFLCVLMPILLSLAIGLATYRLIEHPVNDRLKLWWKKRRMLQKG
jgi:exopolysaccharide production protein ExoZ